jgi:hypothetical protein
MVLTPTLPFLRTVIALRLVVKLEPFPIIKTGSVATRLVGSAVATESLNRPSATLA